jgi:hypothetical protein
MPPTIERTQCEKSKRRNVIVTLKKCLPALALGLAVTVLASPSYARVPEISAARARAIHECSVAADRYPQYLWGNMEIYHYRACMAEHGQQE